MRPMPKNRRTSGATPGRSPFSSGPSIIDLVTIGMDAATMVPTKAARTMRTIVGRCGRT